MGRKKKQEAQQESENKRLLKVFQEELRKALFLYNVCKERGWVQATDKYLREVLFYRQKIECLKTTPAERLFFKHKKK